MKYYIIAGESSGDIYGGLLMSQLQRLDVDAQFRFWGGPKMKEQSSGQLKSIKETSFMGFWEVAKNAMAIRKLFAFAKFSIQDYQPDIIIFLDYPGFNLRMTKWAHQKGYKTCFYISPQLWAWKENRHKILREYVDLFFVILPFERDFYKNLDTPCIYHGHPLLEIIPKKENGPSEIKTVGLFPGSREQEIQKHLPLMIDFAIDHPEYQFVIAGLSHIKKDTYLDNIKAYAGHLDIIYDDAYGVMGRIDAAISSSGTATLELTLFDVPQIVIYKTSALSFAIGKRLVKTPFISLVNLIAQKKVVEELLQDDLNLESIEKAFAALNDESNRLKIKDEYAKIRSSLGDGETSARVAEDIYEYLD